jgi:hypothetical protein
MTDGLKFISRDALLEHRRRQREDGYLFPLTATSIGLDETMTAHVRRLNLTDRAAIDLLPKDVQGVVWEGVKEFDKLQKASKAGRDSPDSLDEAILNNEKSMKAADAFCIAAFIEPRLVATEADLTDGAYVVTDIAAEDRIGLFMICVDADSARAKNLKLFRRKPHADVSNGTAGPMAAPSLYPVESAG